jgi:hypothetical protein
MDPGIEEIHDGDTVWRFDRAFLTSRWTCLWGRGCQGIGPEPAEHLGLGCCSIGADLGDADEARKIAALAAMLAPGRFERQGRMRRRGIAQLAGMVISGMVVFGTVTCVGAPPPTVEVEPEVDATGFPAPLVSSTSTSSVPELSVVTNPPMLGLAIFQSANTMGTSANASIPSVVRSAVNGNITFRVTPCMVRLPVAV